MDDLDFNVKDAVRLAVEYYKSLDEWLPMNDLRLEETVFSPSSDIWKITLSTREGIDLLSINSANRRSYKTIEVDQKTKSILSMQVRNLNAAA